MKEVQKDTGLSDATVSGWGAAVRNTDFSQAAYLGAGAFSVVLDLGDGRVAKVGRNVSALEAALQHVVSRDGTALDVMGFAGNVELPAEVSQRACPVHGAASNSADIIARKMRLGQYECTCDEPVNVLITPRGEPITDDEMWRVEDEMIHVLPVDDSRLDVGMLEWLENINNVASDEAEALMEEWYGYPPSQLNTDRHTEQVVALIGPDNAELRAIDFGMMCDYQNATIPTEVDTYEHPGPAATEAFFALASYGLVNKTGWDRQTAERFNTEYRAGLFGSIKARTFGAYGPVIMVGLFRAVQHGSEYAAEAMWGVETPFDTLVDSGLDPYYVEQAIERGWITQDDIQEMAYYYASTPMEAVCHFALGEITQEELEAEKEAYY